MQNLRYWKLLGKTYSGHIVSGLPCKNYPVCTSRTTSLLTQLPRCTSILSQPFKCRPDNVWTSVSRRLHTPVTIATAPCRSHTQHKQFHNSQPHLYDSSVFESINKDETTWRILANLAESVYQTVVKEHPWVYPYSRTVAFSQKQNVRHLQDLKRVMEPTEMEYMIATTMDSLDHMNTDDMSSVFLDLTHSGLDKTHPLMTKLHLQLQIERESLDFVSLGQYLSSVENYNSSHILIEKYILPQLRHLLQNRRYNVKFEQNPKQFLQALCQFSAHGLVQRIDSALSSDLLLPIFSLCSDHGSIADDLDLIVPVFKLASLFMLGDHQLTFIDSNIQDISGKILKKVTGIMLENIERLNLQHLCAIMAMSAEEHMEFLSKPFLEKIQSRTESILFEMRDYTTYNILELQQLANLSWMKLSAEGRSKLLNFTRDCLQKIVEDPLPAEMIIFFKHSKAVSDMLHDRKVSLTAKQSLMRAIFEVDILQHLEMNEFIELYETVSLYLWSTKQEQKDFTHQDLSESFTNPLLNMTDTMRRVCFAMLINEKITRTSQRRIINEKLAHRFNLLETKKLVQCAGSHDTFYHQFGFGVDKIFRLEGRKRAQAQNDIRQFFLLGSDRSNVRTCTHMSGLPSWRLQQQFCDLTKPVDTEQLDQDIIKVLTYLCLGDFDLPQFEMACSMVLCLRPSSVPILYHSLLNFALIHQAELTASHFRDLLNILVHVGPILTYADKFLQSANKFVDQLTIDTIEAPLLLEMLGSMSELKVFPRDCITRVFQTPYFSKLTELLQSPDLSYNHSALLLNNMVKVNRAVRLKCPEYRVPDLREVLQAQQRPGHSLQELIESHSKPAGRSDDVQGKLVHLIHKQCLQDFLSEMTGGPEFMHINHITSAGLHVDIAVYFDENLDMVNQSQLDDMKRAGKQYSKVAVLCLDKDQIQFNLHDGTTETKQKKDLLEAEGYKVVEVYCWENIGHQKMIYKSYKTLHAIKGFRST